MGNWTWRTKPRSILKTLEWFPYFAQLEGENWDKKTASIHLVRREYIHKAHNDLLIKKFKSDDDFWTGKNDRNEIESNARNDKKTYEFYGFGYVDRTGIVRVTKAGKLIIKKRFDQDILLKQLLKMRFPEKFTRSKKVSDEKYIFPIKVLLEILKEFNYVSKFEMGFMFMTTDPDDIEQIIKSISEFRAKYKKLSNKLKINEVVGIFNKIKNKYFPNTKNKSNTFYNEYPDAFIRTLEYTGLINQRGRGNYKKIYIPEHSKIKIDLLRKEYTFSDFEEDNYEKYMEWFGNPYNIVLPWEDKKNYKRIINNKYSILKKKYKLAKNKNPSFLFNEKIDKLEKKYNSLYSENNEDLKELENYILNELITLNEEIFINYESRTKKVKEEIIEKFIDIEQGNEDLAALWFEVNAWKSLVAIEGNKTVKRNFKLEEDLSPKAFAPGIGNTPDIELYKDEITLLTEVSLMTGVQQWEHEGSSIIAHMKKFIDLGHKKVIGIFITPKINIRTLWLFFILNKTSWIDTPIPVIPLTIKNYKNLIEYIYNNNRTIDYFLKILIDLNNSALTFKNYNDWKNSIDNYINKISEKRLDD